MHIEAIKTRTLLPPQDDLLGVMDEFLPPLSERSVVAVSSKVVAIWQGRCEQIPANTDVYEHKEKVAKREADAYLEKDKRYPFARLFTMNEGIFGSTSGIDESNGNGWLILLPKQADAAAKTIRTHLQTKHNIVDLGVVITDSRARPMRNGATGLAIGHAGFAPLFDYRGTEDLFGRKLKAERLNIADSLAAATSLVMGEGGECTPLVLVSDIPHITFTDSYSNDPLLTKTVEMSQDVFARFFKDQAWRKGGAFSPVVSEASDRRYERSEPGEGGAKETNVSFSPVDSAGSDGRYEASVETDRGGASETQSL